MKARLHAVGTRPLIMHNVQLASPLNPFARRMKAISSKQKKTDDDRLDMARIEFEGSLYFDEELGPYMPASNVFRCLINGAKLTRAGKKIERGVTIATLECPLEYIGPRTVEQLWGEGDSPFVDVRSVRVQQNKIDRCRPIFRNWSFDVDLILDPSILDPSEFVEIAKTAGQVEGIGEYRQMFGRFDGTVEWL